MKKGVLLTPPLPKLRPIFPVNDTGFLGHCICLQVHFGFAETVPDFIIIKPRN